MYVTGELEFTLGDEIGAGEGRNSCVFLARDHQLDADLVVKRVPKSSFDDVDEYFAEAKRLYFSRHPNVVEIKYACAKNDYIYLAMPLYERGSVQSLLRERQLTVREIVRIGLDFLTGLHHVHTRGLIHFDVKPTNVLLDASGKAALSDFGLAKHTDSTGLAEAAAMYDAHWTPEFLLSSHLSSVSDIYQAGLTLYRMCTTPAEFDAQLQALLPNRLEQAIIAGRFPDRSAFPAHIPQRLRRIIRRALEPEPENRYPTVLDLANDLATVDQWLDWRHTHDAAAGEEVWEMVRGVQRLAIRLVERDGTFEVICTKRNLSTGQERRIRVLSARGITRAQAIRCVHNALTDM